MRAKSDFKEASWKAFNLLARNGFSAVYGTNPYDGEGLLVVVKSYFDADSEDYRNMAKKFILL